MRYTMDMVLDRLEIEDLITDYAAAVDSFGASLGRRFL